MSDLDHRLALVAARQHQLITLTDVIAHGGDHHHVRARVRGGQWRRIEPGVYIIASAPIDWTTRMHAVVLSSDGEAVVGFLAAARMLGIRGFAEAGREVVVPRGTRFRRDGVRVHESTDLDLCSTRLVEGVPVTDPDRTMLDIARLLSVRRLTMAVEDARRKDLVTWSSLIACVAMHARRGRPGICRLREVVLTGIDRKEVTDTDVELLVHGLLTGAGLPTPTIHHRVLDGGRFVAEVDLAYPEWRIAIECDGDVHLLPEVRERDLARQNDLVLVGWKVLRFSNDRILERPASVVAEVRAAIAEAERRILGEPATTIDQDPT